MGKKNLKDLIKEFNKDVYNKPNTFKEEGDDHINISLNSKKTLGRFLDPSYSHYFVFQSFGRFRSPLNLAYWLRDEDKDDRLRYLKKKDLNKLAKVKIYPPLDNYKFFLLVSTVIKLKSRPELIEEIKKLPKDTNILSYRTQKNSKIRITTGYAKIVVPIVEEIFNSIWENRDIDYNKFIYTPNELTKSCLPNLDKSLLPRVKKKTILTTKERERINNLGKQTDLNTVVVEDEDGSMTISPEGISFN